MIEQAKSIRTFIGAKNFEESRRFYVDLGFEEHPISRDMSFFRMNKFGFYLQDYYVKNWINNSMLFLEVEDVVLVWEELVKLDLSNSYKKVRLTPIKEYDWGKECFIHDPSGVLWHIGQFS